MRVNIHIREENEDTWKSLVNRSEWVNWHLAEKRTSGEVSPVAVDHEELQKIKTGLVRSHKSGVLSESFVKKVVQKTWCKEHSIQKEYCKGFKHAR